MTTPEPQADVEWADQGVDPERVMDLPDVAAPEHEHEAEAEPEAGL